MEAFTSDCVTRVDSLCARWFPEAARAIPTCPSAALPTIVTLVRPREVGIIFIVGIGLAAAILSAVIMQLVLRN